MTSTLPETIDNGYSANWLALVCVVGVLAFIAGMLVGVHWYDSKYRPEIDRYLKDCRHEH